MNKMFQAAIVAGALSTGFLAFNDPKTKRKMNRKMNQMKRRMARKL